MILRVCVAFIIWALLCAAGLFYFSWQWLNEPQAIPEDYRKLTIERGETLSGLANKLNQQGILRWPKVWLIYAKYSEGGAIKAGEFMLAEDESPITLLERFQSSEVIQYQVTLVEGKTFNQALADIQAHEKIARTLELPLAVDQDLEGFNVDHLEGWIFPDTYHFTAGDTDISILSRAHERMKSVLAQEWQNREEGLPYSTAYEALIMASIVEKETGAAFERREIAGVFVRRLQKNMRLATDPTVIYGMGDDYDGNIRRSDLRKPTPYNTYVIKGLPPSPIALPGREAIHAALHPKPGSSLYFVARGDGTHQFSDTLEEHNRAVAQYQLNRVKNYRSTIQQNQGDENSDEG
jgi:UPF0755 protein